MADELKEKIQTKLSERKYKDAKKLQKELGLLYLQQKNYNAAKLEFEKLKKSPTWFDKNFTHKTIHKRDITVINSLNSKKFSICLGSRGKIVSILSKDMFTETQISSHRNEVTCIENLNNKKFFLATGSYDTTINLYYFNEGTIDYETLETFDHKPIESILYLPTGDLAYSTCACKIHILRYQNETYTISNTLIHDTNIKSNPKVFPICLASNNKLISASQFNIKIWDIDKYEIIKEIDISGGEVYSLCDLKNGTFAAGRKTHIDIYSINGVLVKSLQGHVDVISKMILHTSGYLVSCSFDKTVRIWDLQNKFSVCKWDSDCRSITELNDGRIICSNKTSVDIYDIEDDEEFFTSLIEVYEKLGEKENLNEIYLRLIRYYQENGKYFLSEQILDKIQNQDEISLQLFIKNCGSTSNFKKKIEKQIELAKLFNSEKRILDAERTIKSVDNYETNTSCLIFLQNMYEKSGRIEDQYDTIFDLCNILYDEENYELAEKYMKKIKNMRICEMELLAKILKENEKTAEEAEIYFKLSHRYLHEENNFELCLKYALECESLNPHYSKDEILLKNKNVIYLKHRNYSELKKVQNSLVSIFMEKKGEEDKVNVLFDRMINQYELNFSIKNDIPFTHCIQLTNGNFITTLKESEELKIFNNEGKLIKVKHHPNEITKIIQFSNESIGIVDHFSLSFFSTDLELSLACEETSGIENIIELQNGNILISRYESELIILKKNGEIIDKYNQYDVISCLVRLNSSNFTFATATNYSLYLWKNKSDHFLKSKEKITASETISCALEFNDKLYVSSGKNIQIFKYQELEKPDDSSSPVPSSPLSKMKKFKFTSFDKAIPASICVHKNEKTVKNFSNINSNVFASVSYDSKSMEDILSVWKVTPAKKVTSLFKKKFKLPIKDFSVTKEGNLICCFGKEIQIYSNSLNTYELESFFDYFSKKKDFSRCSKIATKLSIEYLKNEKYGEILKFQKYGTTSFLLDENISISYEKTNDFEKAGDFLLKSATGYFETGKSKYALEMTNKALKMNSKLIENPEFLTLQINCFHQLGNSEQLVKTKIKLGNLYLKQKNYLYASIQFESLTDRTIDSLEPLTECYKQLNDESHFTQITIELATLYYQNEKYKKIDELIEPIEKKNEIQLYWLAKAKEKLNLLEEASRCYVSSSLELLKKNLYSKACENFRSAIELNSKLKSNSNVLKLFATALQRIQFDGHHPTSNQLVKKEILQVANWLKEANQLTEAAAIYQDFEPKDEEILLILIQIYQELNNKILIQQRVSDLADIYLEKKNYQKVIQLSSLIEPNSTINRKLSIAFENIDQLENASKCLYLVAKDYFDHSSYDYCIDLLKRAEQLNPNSIEIFQLFFDSFSKLSDDISASMYCVKMGKYYESIKEHKKSEDYYKTALNLDPKAFTVTKKSKGGEYIQIKKIAIGGQASVFLCKNQSTNSKRQIICAMKELICDGFDDANKAMAELLMINEISHQNIVEFLDMYLEINPKSEETTLSIIMPYYVIGDLHKYWLQQVNPTKSQIINFAKQIIEGIHHLHQHKVIHRDLKPANILMHSNSNGEIILKLADFGLSSAANENSFQQSIVGTSDWMAHEVRSGSKYDGRKADLFSFGLIFYFLISQSVMPAIDLVLSSKNSLDIMSKKILQVGFSYGIRDLVLSLVAEDPNLRPSTKEVIQILETESTQIVPSPRIDQIVKLPEMPKQILAFSKNDFIATNPDQLSVAVMIGVALEKENKLE
eukprot:gene5868-9696_t